MSIRSCLIAIVPAILLFTSLDASAKKDKGGDAVEIPCLTGEVEVILDRDGVPHIFAENDLDLFCAEGYVHARDRFFQMDLTRRQVSGDLAFTGRIGAGEPDHQIHGRALRRRLQGFSCLIRRSRRGRSRRGCPPRPLEHRPESRPADRGAARREGAWPRCAVASS